MKKIYNIYIRTVGDKKESPVVVEVALVSDLNLATGAANEYLRLHMEEIKPHPFNTISIPPLQHSLVESSAVGQAVEFPMAANFWQDDQKYWKPEIFMLGITAIPVLDSMTEIKNSITGLSN